MNVKRFVLLTVTSAALFAAAPISAQERAKPANLANTVAVDPTSGSGRTTCLARTYGLTIEATSAEFRVLDGRPYAPFGLLLGVRDLYFPLPGGATLRVDPLLAVYISNFDAAGEYVVRLPHSGSIQPAEFFMQVLSVKGDKDLFCVSELIWLRTNLANEWHFELRG